MPHSKQVSYPLQRANERKLGQDLNKACSAVDANLLSVANKSSRPLHSHNGR